MDKQQLKRRSVSVQSLSSDDSNASTGINSKDNDGSKCCGKCNKIVIDESKAVCCDYCSLWFHVKRESITDEIYKYLNVGRDQVHCYCESCNNKALDVMKLIQGHMEKIDVFEARVGSFTSQDENLALVKGSFAEKQIEMVNEEVY